MKQQLWSQVKNVQMFVQVKLERTMLFPRLVCVLFLVVLVNAAEQIASDKGLGCVYGHPGIPGDPGHNGMPGRDGRDGAKGDKGDRGDIGTCGESGKPGPKGDQGEPGVAGITGAKGKRGETGERGSPGKMGPQGFAGPLGLKGQKGELGLPGPQGIKGDVGPIGPEGPQGRTGPKGEIGHPGIKGSIGIRGEKGSKGDFGEQGPKGDMPEIPKSAFSARLSESTKLPPANTPIRFDKVLYNGQGHYDPETGRFTCAIRGAYYFTYHITVFSRNVKVVLMKNGQRMIYTMDTYQGGEDQAGGGAVLELDVGDKVWLQVADRQLFNGLYADDDDDTVFSGFLFLQHKD
ncbi:hypothetical protein DNTS_022337 [Danionella cerebrum]|uniref:C1q domain-containing protein n=1 Tax=Danionella cerebrum TaxID=2873325 RepID=A0A553N089_9TELE|nr:hypothetical protein DNTS_022337 [Danionella translucida]